MSQFEKKLLFIWKHATEKYPQYLFGYRLRPDPREMMAHESSDYVDMSIMFKNPNYSGVVRRVKLELGQEPKWYANQWLEMMKELDPNFVNKSAAETGITAAESIVADGDEKAQDTNPAEEENLGGIQQASQAA